MTGGGVLLSYSGVLLNHHVGSFPTSISPPTSVSILLHHHGGSFPSSTSPSPTLVSGLLPHHGGSFAHINISFPNLMYFSPTTAAPFPTLVSPFLTSTSSSPPRWSPSTTRASFSIGNC
ncbi:hypothetical protein BDA96_06G071700 [Sorghum bicolor]|uniref:Uncharacterized protein n=2 Tax=Sorghum bicolor TaxID=4558 RepID=A0A921QPT2_SORBI|nr:hypothetical protein BDA96_06G071700 [Sorghum bicolor]OQU81476.1 hypothetical protein SORBI_3006G064450 [Sorghum bicolor]